LALAPDVVEFLDFLDEFLESAVGKLEEKELPRLAASSRDSIP
jgi:hypothetical protein